MDLNNIKQDSRFLELVDYYLNDWAGEGWKYDPAMADMALSDCFSDTYYEVEDSFPGLDDGEIEDIKTELESVVYTEALKRYKNQKA